MKIVFLNLCLLTLISCGQRPEEKLGHLNGYWEIQSVELVDGQIKEYQFSQNIDFIELDAKGKGFRKKVQPRFSGGFTTSKDIEKLAAKIENDSLHIYYTNEYDQWKETVLKANETQLSIINKDKKTYTYRRYQPLNIKN